MQTEARELLHECDTCRKDYPARQWHRSECQPGREGVTRWTCPQGHEQVWCDSEAHQWDQIDETGQECRWCGAWRLHING